MLLQVCRPMGNMFVLPIHFSEEHKNMLGYTKRLNTMEAASPLIPSSTN
jgi:hypothetical protein